MSHPFRLIMFDFDGTLVDSQRSIAQSMARAFEAEGLPAPAREAVRRVVGLRLEMAAAQLLPDPSDTDTAVRIAESYRKASQALPMTGLFFTGRGVYLDREAGICLCKLFPGASPPRGK